MYFNYMFFSLNTQGTTSSVGAGNWDGSGRPGAEGPYLPPAPPTCVYVCMYVCMYIYIYIYIHIHICIDNTNSHILHEHNLT